MGDLKPWLNESDERLPPIARFMAGNETGGDFKTEGEFKTGGDFKTEGDFKLD